MFNLFTAHPVGLAQLWDKHNVTPVKGCWFAGEDDPQGRPEGADLIGILLVEHLGWDKALSLTSGEGIPPVKEVINRLNGDQWIPSGVEDIGLPLAVSEALNISFMAYHFLTLGWNWDLKGTDKEFEVPFAAHDYIGQAAYKLGVETRIEVEKTKEVVIVED